ncbi:hypothetical protein G6F32_015741 [Rhizopus arrhizus]|nr:hypothetical protein G6F32_015741 [Rhizopus arrhizus]
MRVAIQVVQQKGLARTFRQAFQDGADLGQRLRRHQNLFGRGRARVSGPGQAQLGQIGLFHLAAAGLVDDEPAGCHRQEGARFAHRGQGVARCQDAGKGVVRHVRRIVRAAQLFLQPSQQPAAVVDVPGVQLGIGAGGCRRHEGRAVAGMTKGHPSGSL